MPITVKFDPNRNDPQVQVVPDATPFERCDVQGAGSQAGWSHSGRRSCEFLVGRCHTVALFCGSRLLDDWINWSGSRLLTVAALGPIVVGAYVGVQGTKSGGAAAMRGRVTAIHGLVLTLDTPATGAVLGAVV